MLNYNRKLLNFLKQYDFYNNNPINKKIELDYHVVRIKEIETTCIFIYKIQNLYFYSIDSLTEHDDIITGYMLEVMIEISETEFNIIHDSKT